MCAATECAATIDGIAEEEAEEEARQRRAREAEDWEAFNSVLAGVR